MHVMNLYGFDRFFQILDSTRSMRPSFGAIIRVPSISPNTQFNISIANTMNIELHMHFIRNIIHYQVIEFLFCPTEDQVANIFTNSLTEVNFSKFDLC